MPHTWDDQVLGLNSRVMKPILDDERQEGTEAWLIVSVSILRHQRETYHRGSSRHKSG